MTTSALTNFTALVESDPSLFDVQTTAAGPAGSLPLTEELLREAPSGDLFGWTQDVGMGWQPSELGRREFLLLSTSGGLRDANGKPIALGYHTDHWEVGLSMKARRRRNCESSECGLEPLRYGRSRRRCASCLPTVPFWINSHFIQLP